MQPITYTISLYNPTSQHLSFKKRTRSTKITETSALHNVMDRLNRCIILNILLHLAQAHFATKHRDLQFCDKTPGNYTNNLAPRPVLQSLR